MLQLSPEQRLDKLEEGIAGIRKMVSALLDKFSLGPVADQKNEIMSAKQLAAFMHIDVSVIYIKCAKKEIPYFKLGKQYRFKKIDILNWIKAQKSESEFSVDTYANRYLQKNELRG